MRKIVKARKTYSCSTCKRVINVGDKYIFGSHREPRYVEDVMGNAVQDGIEYIQYHLCLRADCYVYWTRESEEKNEKTDLIA